MTLCESQFMLNQDYKLTELTFSYSQCFLLLCLVHIVIFICKTQNRRPNKLYTENLTAKLQNSNQNSSLSRVSLIGF